MAARTKSKVTPKYKTKYRVTNWPEYEASLRMRGDVSAWFDEEAVSAWNAPASARFTADGAYDTRTVYEALAASGDADVTVVVPPKRTAASEPRAAGPWRQRNAASERIAQVGRRHWRKEAGAHQQARAEGGVFRYNRSTSDGLRAKEVRGSRAGDKDRCWRTQPDDRVRETRKRSGCRVRAAVSETDLEPSRSRATTPNATAIDGFL